MRNHRNQNQSGFTLIELVIVIVIIGILAAVAIPKFVALSEDAKVGVAKGIAAAAASAAATNYAASRGSLASSKVVDACNDLATMIDMPATGYTIGTTPLGSASPSTCSIAIDGSTQTATFTAYGT